MSIRYNFDNLSRKRMFHSFTVLVIRISDQAGEDVRREKHFYKLYNGYNRWFKLFENVVIKSP